MSKLTYMIYGLVGLPNQLSSSTKRWRLWYFFWKFSMWTHPSCDCQVRPYDQDKEADEVSMPLGDPLGDTIYSKCFPPLYYFFVFSIVFSGFSQNHSNCSNPDQDQKVWYGKGLHTRKSLSMFIFGFITFYQSTSSRAIKSYKTAI